VAEPFTIRGNIAPMVRVRLLAVVLVLVSATVAADEKLAINCHEQPAPKITGDHGELRVSGKCTSFVVAGNGNTVKGAWGSATIEVTGNDNTIEVYDTDQIVVRGDRNSVEYMHGYSVKTPDVADSGKDNRITQHKLHP
jgi:hypothetical protein